MLKNHKLIKRHIKLKFNRYYLPRKIPIQRCHPGIRYPQLRKQQSHVPLYPRQKQRISDPNGYGRIFPLPVNASHPAERLSKNRILWVSPSVQQEAYQISPIGLTHKPFSNIQTEKAATENHLSKMWINHENCFDLHSRTTAAYLINKGGKVM